MNEFEEQINDNFEPVVGQDNLQVQEAGEIIANDNDQYNQEDHPTQVYKGVPQNQGPIQLNQVQVQVQMQIIIQGVSNLDINLNQNQNINLIGAMEQIIVHDDIQPQQASQNDSSEGQKNHLTYIPGSNRIKIMQKRAKKFLENNPLHLQKANIDKNVKSEVGYYRILQE